MLKSKHKQTLQKGFTLIELLVVISIISLLSSIVMVNLVQGRKKGRDAKRIEDLHQIANALELYNADNGGTYPDCTSVGYPGGCDIVDFPVAGTLADSSADGIFLEPLKPYMAAVPKDPINNLGQSYIYGYGANMEYPGGSGHYYAYLLATNLEDLGNPAIKSSIGYGDPLLPPTAYVIGVAK